MTATRAHPDPQGSSRPARLMRPARLGRLGVACAVACALVPLSGCEVSGAERGEEVFRSRSLSKTDLNLFSCATCHDASSGAPLLGNGKAGYNMYGAANRPSFWGGDRTTLRDAVDACLVFFMKADPIDPDGGGPQADDARALFEFLISIAPPGAPSEPLPFSVVENVADVARTDPGLGERVYERSCRTCHGAAFTGTGSILRAGLDLPGITETYPDIFPGIDPSLVVIEKVRHGRFFDIGGDMPLYSLEAMTDEELGALLAFLGL